MIHINQNYDTTDKLLE